MNNIIEKIKDNFAYILLGIIGLTVIASVWNLYNAHLLNKNVTLLNKRIEADEQIIMALVKGELPRVPGDKPNETIPTIKLLGGVIQKLNQLEQTYGNAAGSTTQ